MVHIEIKDADGHPVALDWWAVALRGVVAILFGLIALFMPGAAIGAFVLLFAAYMIFDGVFAIIAAVRAIRRHRSWGLLVFEGVVNLAAAAVAILWPAITVVVFVYLVGFWAILSGGFLLAATFSHPPQQGRWLMAIGAVISIVWGILLFAAPLLGALVLTWWIAAYALFFGGALLALAFRLHRVQADHHRGTPRTV